MMAKICNEIYQLIFFFLKHIKSLFVSCAAFVLTNINNSFHLCVSVIMFEISCMIKLILYHFILTLDDWIQVIKTLHEVRG